MYLCTHVCIYAWMYGVCPRVLLATLFWQAASFAFCPWRKPLIALIVWIVGNLRMCVFSHSVCALWPAFSMAFMIVLSAMLWFLRPVGVPKHFVHGNSAKMVNEFTFLRKDQVHKFTVLVAVTCDWQKKQHLVIDTTIRTPFVRQVHPQIFFQASVSQPGSAWQMCFSSQHPNPDSKLNIPTCQPAKCYLSAYMTRREIAQHWKFPNYPTTCNRSKPGYLT